MSNDKFIDLFSKKQSESGAVTGSMSNVGQFESGGCTGDGIDTITKYADLAREWAISDDIVEDEVASDRSSKYWAQKSKEWSGNPQWSIDLSLDYPWTGIHTHTEHLSAAFYQINREGLGLYNHNNELLIAGSVGSNATLVGNVKESTYINAPESGEAYIRPGGIDSVSYRIYHEGNLPIVQPEGTSYNTVGALKGASLSAGLMAFTLGYYEKGDDGRASYAIIAPEDYPSTPDEIFDFRLPNGNVARLTRSNDINVLHGGAKGDGTTDNLKILNASIVLLPLTGGAVVIPPSNQGSNYYVSDSVVINRSNVSIELLVGAQIFCTNDTTYNSTIAFFHPTPGLQLQNCHIYGGGTVLNTSQTSEERGIGFARVNYFSCRNMHIPSAGKSAIGVLNNCDNGTIDSNFIGTVGSYGIIAEGDTDLAGLESDKLAITNNVIEDAGEVGIYVDYVNGPFYKGVITAGNVVRKSGTMGFYFAGCQRMSHFGGDKVLDAGEQGYSYLFCQDVHGSIESYQSTEESVKFFECSGRIKLDILSRNSSFYSSNTYDAVYVESPSSSYELNLHIEGSGHKSVLNTVDGDLFPVLINNPEIVDDGLISRFLGTPPIISDFGKLNSGVNQDGQTDISVLNVSMVEITNTNSTNLSSLSDGHDKKVVELYFLDGNTTVVHGVNMLLSQSMDVNPPADSVLTLRFFNGFWYETSRNFPSAATPGVMIWKGAWDSNSVYNAYDVVTDGSWAMVANKVTEDTAAPQPVGSPLYSLSETPLWATMENQSVVVSGNRFAFDKGGWVKEIRAWIPTLTTTTSYYFLLINDTDPANPTSIRLSEGLLQENDWSILLKTNLLVTPGQSYIIAVDALDSGDSLEVTGGWSSGAGDNNLAPGDIPPVGSWDRNRQQMFNFSHQDLDGTDRSTELSGIIPGSTLTITQTDTTDNSWTMTINSITDFASHISFSTIRTDTTGDPAVGVPTTCVFDIPTPDPTDYVMISDHWLNTQPDFATVRGYLAFNGVEEPGTFNHAFGTDVLFQPAYVSPDWDYLSNGG